MWSLRRLLFVRETGSSLRILEVCGPHQTQISLVEAYLHTKWHLSPSSHLATTDISQKLGGLCPFRGGELGGPYLTQCREG